GSIVYAFAFAFQIYGDFSGYSDIARGVAKLMGFELMLNFRRPYLTRNPSEFWRHWHISLSSWLRDYLYIPLGGNRGGEVQTYRNLMITMILGGLWHGAGWGFVLWGLFHGGFLAVHRLWTRRISPALAARRGLSAPPEATRRGLGHALIVAGFFTVFVTHWMLFRSSSLPEGESQLAYAANWFVQFTRWGGSADVIQYLPALVVFGLLALLPQWKDEAMERFHTWRPSVQGLAVAAALWLIAVFGVFEGTEFIYFQF
ncbi:MAG: MBOAT family O-acyltransferase, partial [Bacteroidota bacterium]